MVKHYDNDYIKVKTNKLTEKNMVSGMWNFGTKEGKRNKLNLY
jgi:hypothetical protein